MKLKKILSTLLMSISLSGAAYADKFHCRITEAVNYDTRESVNLSSSINEFIVSTDTETDIYKAGDVHSPHFKGSLISGTDEHTAPFIVISKLDYKFYGMYVFQTSISRGLHASGFCKEINSYF
jgi:hypothetical protein